MFLCSYLRILSFVLFLIIFQLINFYSSYCSYFSTSFLTGDFPFDSHTVNFTFLRAGYYCFPKNILEIYSGIWLSYSELLGNSLVHFSLVFMRL